MGKLNWWLVGTVVVLLAVEYVSQRIELSERPRVRTIGYTVAGVVALLLFAVLFFTK